MKPWLMLPTKLAHDLAPIGLQILSAFREPKAYAWRPLQWHDLEFKNRLGIAGGVDKDAAQVENWWCFGPGFIEVGTVTPEPQAPNPGKIMDRDVENGALWNKMGFPGGGLDVMKANLKDLPPERTTPLFVNIGKNRTTPNENAADDYVRCIREIGTLADAFVVNISSPNTSGLRELFLPSNFRPFLKRILQARETWVPVLLKLSPDLSNDDLQNVVTVAAELGIDGFIATNTTLNREPGSKFPAEGGVSGRPLAEQSKATLKSVLQILGPMRQGKLIVSTGGVMTPEDVFERLQLGADLVQVYSTLIYEGPGFFSRVARASRKAASTVL